MINDNSLRLAAKKIAGNNEKLIKDQFNEWLEKRIEERAQKIKKEANNDRQ